MREELILAPLLLLQAALASRPTLNAAFGTQMPYGIRRRPARMCCSWREFVVSGTFQSLKKYGGMPARLSRE